MRCVFAAGSCHLFARPCHHSCVSLSALNKTTYECSTLLPANYCVYGRWCPLQPGFVPFKPLPLQLMPYACLTWSILALVLQVAAAEKRLRLQIKSMEKQQQQQQQSAAQNSGTVPASQVVTSSRAAAAAAEAAAAELLAAEEADAAAAATKAAKKAAKKQRQAEAKAAAEAATEQSGRVPRSLAASRAAGGVSHRQQAAEVAAQEGSSSSNSQATLVGDATQQVQEISQDLETENEGGSVMPSAGPPSEGTAVAAAGAATGHVHVPHGQPIGGPSTGQAGVAISNLPHAVQQQQQQEGQGLPATQYSHGGAPAQGGTGASSSSLAPAEQQQQHMRAGVPPTAPSVAPSSVQVLPRFPTSAAAPSAPAATAVRGGHSTASSSNGRSAAPVRALPPTATSSAWSRGDALEVTPGGAAQLSPSAAAPRLALPGAVGLLLELSERCSPGGVAAASPSPSPASPAPRAAGSGARSSSGAGDSSAGMWALVTNTRDLGGASNSSVPGRAAHMVGSERSNFGAAASASTAQPMANNGPHAGGSPVPRVPRVQDGSPGRAPVVHQAIKPHKECVVCMAARSCVLQLPCGHLCCCQACMELLRGKSQECPMCRTRVTDYWML
jgi:hypothetical protein